MPVLTPLSHYVPARDEHPRLREMTVGDLLDEAADQWPDREALVYSAYEDLGISVRWSFDELRRRSLDVARAMLATGLEGGDRVGVWATNSPEWVLLQFGAAYAGVVLVPMNPLYRSAEVAYVLSKAGATACFVEPENRGTSLWDVLDQAAADVPSLRLRVALGDAPDARGPAFHDWLEAGSRVRAGAVERRCAAVRPEDTAQIQFTSGTTGFPKGAELRHVGVANNGRLFAHRARFRLDGRHCNPMPFFHCGGCVQATLGTVAAGSAHLPTLTFDAARMVRTIDQEQATSAGAVPTMLIALDEEVDRAGGSLQSLEVVVTGGSPVPVEVERRWIERYGVRFTICYGMTEASPVVTQSDPDDPEDLQIATCGRPLPHIEVDIVGPGSEGRVPLGEQGELRSRSVMVMNGYWNDEAATRAAIDPGGWLRSGDLARMDAAGYITITGRAKEMIIRGGENIYPAEIEDALRALPGVADASVVGIPDERYGEVVAAFVRPAEGAGLTGDDVRRQLQERVARYKIPRYLEIVDAFPLTPSGKVQKFRLREQFLAAQRTAAGGRG
jgi:acyl-CoA synthetase (AMP-forming)/AMP-acid ligase II